MRRLALPKLMFISPLDNRRMGIGARDLMASAWRLAFSKTAKPKRRVYCKGVSLGR